VCDHFVRDSARVPLPLTVTVQHRLLLREYFTNVCRMFWQGALPRKFANFKMQNDECHN
jgi:hypothetical protein